jgi:sigma-E factor negative regulatory protein RseC
MSDRNMIVEVDNTLKAKAGDTVELSIPIRSLLKVSLIVYIIPVAALIAGALVGRAWGKSFGGNADIFAIIGGLLAMGVAFFILKWFDRMQNRRSEYQPRLTRIMTSVPLHPPSSDSK